MVILYVILGAIAYFNFGFHHILIERFGERNATLTQPAWEEPGENTQTKTPQELQDPSADQQETEQFKE